MAGRFAPGHSLPERRATAGRQAEHRAAASSGQRTFALFLIIVDSSSDSSGTRTNDDVIGPAVSSPSSVLTEACRLVGLPILRIVPDV